MLYKNALELLEVPEEDANKLLTTYEQDLNKAPSQEKRDLVTKWFSERIAILAVNKTKKCTTEEQASKFYEVYQSIRPNFSLINYSSKDFQKMIGQDLKEKHPCLGHGLYGKPYQAQVA